MKKITMWMMAMLFGASALMMTGCSSNKLDVKEKVKNEAMQNELEGAPQWVMVSPDNSDNLYGVGISEHTNMDFSFQKAEAMGYARDEIARNISTKVKNMLKTFKEKTGTGKEATFDKVVTNVSKQIAKQTLTGSKQANMWISKSGNLYVLVSMPKENIKAEVKSTLRNSFKNDNAAWQQFKSKQAQEELDKAVDKEFN